MGALARLLLRGSGISATTIAHLLAGEDVPIAIESGRAPAPVVMLGDAALALLRDLYGRPDLFAGRPRIERRVVDWGGKEPVTLPHGAIVLSGAELAAALPAPKPSGSGAADFSVYGSPPYPSGTLHCFGMREAAACTVRLMPAADQGACHVEAVEAGWLFLVPLGNGNGWLLAVGGAPDTLLGGSRTVATQIASLGAVAARFETAPRINNRLAGDDWLACGTAAIAFDPICGDGTAQALRQAILAAAVVLRLRATDRSDERAALTGHYRAMLIAAMRRHLQISLPFYQTGSTGDWWRLQADALLAGHRWCTAQLGVEPEPRYALHGLRLVPRQLAA